MDEIKKIDKSFNKSMFITKANNIFIMLHTAIMMDDLNRVRHFISDELENKYESIIQNYNNNNLRKMYDELNVKTTEIKYVEIEDDKININVDLVSRYMDYFIDKETGENISGENNKRIEKLNHLVFEKRIGNQYNNIARSCPGCGANIDVNSSGKCEYCGTIFNTEDYDWILTDIETIDI